MPNQPAPSVSTAGHPQLAGAASAGAGATGLATATAAGLTGATAAALTGARAAGVTGAGAAGLTGARQAGPNVLPPRPATRPPETARRTLPPRAAYGLAASVIGLGLFASVTPSPLYHSYSVLWHFSPLTLTLIFATYAFGVLTTLLLAGRVSSPTRSDGGRCCWPRSGP